MSLTSPLGLMRHVHKPDLRLEVVPWLNVLLVAWMLSLLQSTFIYAPGIAVALTPLDRQDKAKLPATANLPVIAGAKLPGQRVDARISIQPPLFILDNSIHHFDNDRDHDLADALKEAYASLRDRHVQKPVLLILASGKTDWETVLKVSALATAAGFETQQMGASTDPYSSRNDNGAPAAPSPAGAAKP